MAYKNLSKKQNKKVSKLYKKADKKYDKATKLAENIENPGKKTRSKALGRYIEKGNKLTGKATDIRYKAGKKADGASAKFPEIKEKNEGKFTAWVEKNMGGMDTCKAASKVMRSRTKKYSPAVVKMANYANNFGCKTKKDDGSSVPLKGKQKNLPEALKSKILASDGASMKEEPKEKGKIKQAVENFKTRNELVAYKRKNPKPGQYTNIITTKKKAKKLEKKETKAAKSQEKSSSKSSKAKTVKYKAPKNAKYGIQKGKKGFQKTRKK